MREREEQATHQWMVIQDLQGQSEEVNNQLEEREQKLNELEQELDRVEKEDGKGK